MAVLKKWDLFFDRADLTTNDSFQIVGFDLSNPDLTKQNQRTPITQLLRAGKNLSDLTNATLGRSNLGLGNVDNTSDVNKPISTATQDALNLKANSDAVLLTINSDAKQNQTLAGSTGIIVLDDFDGIHYFSVDDTVVTIAGNSFNGISQLVQTDVTGKIPLSVLPTGSTLYRGTWNATTNTPALSNSTIEASGHFYIVSVAGNVNFGAGSISFDVGDWVISNGTVWGKVDNSDAVTSVNGAQGAISLGIHNLDDTQASTPINNDILIFDNSISKWKNLPVTSIAFNPALGGGDLNGTIGVPQVVAVGTSTAAAVNTATLAANAATAVATASTIAKRDASANCGYNGITLVTTGGTPALLDYCENGTFSITLSGPVTLSPAVAFSRVGKIVTLTVQSQAGTATVATSFSGSAQIPARLRPNIPYDGFVLIEDNGIYQATPGRIRIGTNGDISIYKSSPSMDFTGSGQCGWVEITFTYRVA